MSWAPTARVVGAALVAVRGCIAVLKAGDIFIGRIPRELGNEEARPVPDEPGPPRASVTVYRS